MQKAILMNKQLYLFWHIFTDATMQHPKKSTAPTTCPKNSSCQHDLVLFVYNNNINGRICLMNKYWAAQLLCTTERRCLITYYITVVACFRFKTMFVLRISLLYFSDSVSGLQGFLYGFQGAAAQLGFCFYYTWKMLGDFKHYRTFYENCMYFPTRYMNKQSTFIQPFKTDSSQCLIDLLIWNHGKGWSKH